MMSTSPRTELHQFPLFAALPTELRLQIWQHTLPHARILKISYSPAHNAYISNTPPPATLSINRESRRQALLSYSQLLLGSQARTAAISTSAAPRIPMNPGTETLYISNLAPILQTHLHDLLYNLSTAPSRHAIRFLAFDLRVWRELCDQGLLGVLAKMRALDRVDMVVEFGRHFSGEVGFLETPEWRGDLRLVAERARREVGDRWRSGRRVMLKAGGVGAGLGAGVGKIQVDGREEDVGISVRCVILTKGGEQA